MTNNTNIRPGSIAIIKGKSNLWHSFYVGQKVEVIWTDEEDAFCMSTMSSSNKQLVSLQDIEPYEELDSDN